MSRKSVMWINFVHNICCTVAFYAQNLLFLWFTQFCCKVGFVEIYALLQGEKLSQKFYLWRKNNFSVSRLVPSDTYMSWWMLQIILLSRYFEIYLKDLSVLFSSITEQDSIRIWFELKWNCSSKYLALTLPLISHTYNSLRKKTLLRLRRYGEFRVDFVEYHKARL